MRKGFLFPVVLLIAANFVSAQNPPHLREMPSVSRVMLDVRGSDAMDTAARQSGTFNQLVSVIRDIALANGRNASTVPLTPDETKIMTVYSTASIETWKPVKAQWAQFPPDRRNQLMGYATNPAFRAQVLSQFCSSELRFQYAKALEKFAARHQEFVAMQQQYDQMAKIAASGGGANSDPGTLALRRCYASGRGIKECFAEIMAGYLPGFIPVLKQEKPAPGLRLTGKFAGDGMTFVFPNRSKEISWTATVALPESCGNPVGRGTPYSISNTGTQITMKIETKPAVVFTLQPNLEWKGPGRVTIAGEKIVGYGPPHDVTTSSITTNWNQPIYHNSYGQTVGQSDPGAQLFGYGWQSASTTSTVRDPITEPIQAPCTFNSIRLVGPATDVTGVAQSFGLQEIPPGLRMVGDYSEADGLGIKFHPESATTTCSGSEWTDKYEVVATGTDIRIKLQNGKSPYEMILKPDGTLAPAAAGSVTVVGREMIGMKDGEGVFKPLPPKTCSLGLLSAVN